MAKPVLHSDAWGHIGTFLPPRDLGSLATTCKDAKEGVSKISLKSLQNHEAKKIDALIKSLLPVFPDLDIEKRYEKVVLDGCISRLKNAQSLSDTNIALRDFSRHIQWLSSDDLEDKSLFKAAFLLYRAKKEGRLPLLIDSTSFSLDKKLYHLLEHILNEYGIAAFLAVGGAGLPPILPAIFGGGGGPPVEDELFENSAVNALFRLKACGGDLPRLRRALPERHRGALDEFREEFTTLNSIKRKIKYMNSSSRAILAICIPTLVYLSYNLASTMIREMHPPFEP